MSSDLCLFWVLMEAMSSSALRYCIIEISSSINNIKIIVSKECVYRRGFLAVGGNLLATLIKLRLLNETADKQKLIDYLLKNAFK